MRFEPDWLEWVTSAPREESGAVAPAMTGARPANIPEAIWQASPRLAWDLGVIHGKAAALDNIAVDNPTNQPVLHLLATYQDDIHKISTALDVPTPAPPVIRQQAFAFREFAESLYEQPTAIAFSQRYASSHAALFRLGALSGYRSIVVSLIDDPDSMFALEIRRHGMATGLAKDLWQPLASPLSTSGKGAAAEFDQRLQRVSEALAPAAAGSP